VTPPSGGGTSPPAPPPAPTGGETTTPAGGGSAATVASIDISTEPPGAKIFFNDVEEPNKTPIVKDGLAAGDYTVRAEKTGWLPSEQRVTVAAGDHKKLAITLEPELGVMGTLIVKVIPYATFYVNGKLVGQPNVVSTTVSLKPGVYTVRAEHPSFPAKVWNNVRIEPSGTTNLSNDFLHIAAGTLRVTSPDGWAYVWLDNKPTGKTTPVELNDLKPGVYTVTLVKEGFTVQGGARQVTIKDGSVSSLEFHLVKN
jgi:hypothetical protein